MHRQLSASVFSKVDRARRRQQSEQGSAPLAMTPRSALSRAMPSRYTPPAELRSEARSVLLETPSRADVVIVGVPGIGKSAVCEFLSRHGLKAANVELERGCALPEQVSRARGLIVGLMMRPDRLIAERRIRTAAQPDRSADIEPQSVRDELIAARRLFNASSWHIIDMSHQSPAAVAARIIAILQRRRSDPEE